MRRPVLFAFACLAISVGAIASGYWTHDFACSWRGGVDIAVLRRTCDESSSAGPSTSTAVGASGASLSRWARSSSSSVRTASTGCRVSSPSFLGLRHLRRAPGDRLAASGWVRPLMLALNIAVCRTMMFTAPRAARQQRENLADGPSDRPTGREPAPRRAPQPIASDSAEPRTMDNQSALGLDPLRDIIDSPNAGQLSSRKMISMLDESSAVRHNRQAVRRRGDQDHRRTAPWSPRMPHRRSRIMGSRWR